VAAQSTRGGFGHEAGTSLTDPAPLFKRAWGDQHADELVVVVVVVVVLVVVLVVVVVLAIVRTRHIRRVHQSVPLLLTYVHACSRAILVPTHAHPIVGVIAGDFGQRSSAGHSRLHAIAHAASRAARHVGGRVGGGRRLGRCSTSQAGVVSGVNEAQHEHLAQRC
jgi:hypothetical protein